MTETILVPVEPSEEMLRAADSVTDLIMPAAVDPSVEGRLKEFKLAWHMMLAHAPKPTIPEDAREEVARAIYAARVEKLGLDLTYGGACGSDRRIAQACADAAIRTLISLGWSKAPTQQQEGE